MDNGVSSAELSRRSGISLRTIEDIIVRGDCRFSTAEKIAKALGVEVGDLCVQNYIFASHESDFEKASRVQPPYRTPCISSECKHFIDAAEELEQRYKSRYPDLFSGDNLYYYCVNAKGEHARFTYSFDYREFGEESPELP